MKTVTLATGLATRGGRVLLVASRYANQPKPLWNLPGGRQQPFELLVETVVREVREETGYEARVRSLAYVSESYDRGDDVHFINATYAIDVSAAASLPAATDDHVVATEWVTPQEIGSRIVVAIVREPLLAYLESRLPGRYAGLHDAGITIRWPTETS